MHIIYIAVTPPECESIPAAGSAVDEGDLMILKRFQVQFVFFFVVVVVVFFYVYHNTILEIILKDITV